MQLKNLTILIVDDEQIQIKIIKKYLEDEDFTLLSANDGFEALELFKKSKIDLIITDLNMPIMNGIEFIQKIREKSFWIPIIVVTSNITANYMIPCVNSNIQGLIEKPVTLEKLNNIFKQLDNYGDTLTSSEVNNIVQLDEEIYYDLTNSIINNKNEEFSLSKKERLLLELLIENKNSLVSYKNIETVIWYYDDKVMTSDALKNVIKSLRKKLSKDIIKNVSGLGYKIIIENTI